MLASKDTTARVAAYVEMCDFPCSKQELLQQADEQEFPDEVMDVLEDLPSQNYASESHVIDEAAQTAEEKMDSSVLS